MTNKERLCSTCIYGDKIEYDKPCVIYSDNCQMYEEKKHMTNEEAIKILKGAIKKPNTKDGYLGQAIDKAIKALEQQPCEDAISRQAVLDNAYAYGYGLEPEGYCVNVEDIQALPPVTPSRPIEQEPRQGHWIKVTNGRGGHECDVCHNYAPSFQTGDEYLSAFCPNCGADMRESEE